MRKEQWELVDFEPTVNGLWITLNQKGVEFYAEHAIAGLWDQVRAEMGTREDNDNDLWAATTRSVLEHEGYPALAAVDDQALARILTNYINQPDNYTLGAHNAWNYAEPIELDELVEDALCNGWDWIDHNRIALCGNEYILAQGALDEDGDLIAGAAVYMYLDYQIKNPVAVLQREGSVFFTRTTLEG